MILKKSTLKMFKFLSTVLFFLVLLDYSTCKTSSECDQLLKDSLKTFSTELKAVNLSAATDYQSIYNQICSTNGIVNRFEFSVKDTAQAEQCIGQEDTFTYQLCEVRTLKLNVGRYTWTPTLLLDICNRTLPFFSADFFRHEQCIAKVLNAYSSTCDRVHYNLVKTSTGANKCNHWNDFRNCALAEVEKACGNVAANVSDYLLHLHASYFADYRSCGFSPEPYTAAMTCWYERPGSQRDQLLEFLKRKKSVASGKGTETTVETTTEDLGGAEPSIDDDGDEEDNGEGKDDVNILATIGNSSATLRTAFSLLITFLVTLFLARKL